MQLIDQETDGSGVTDAKRAVIIDGQSLQKESYRVRDRADDSHELNFADLSYQEFELIVGALLARSGFQNISQPRRGQLGPDFAAVLPGGERLIVEVKHFRQAIPRSMVHRFVGDIARYRLQAPRTKGLFVLSGELSALARQSIAEQDGLDVWTGDDLRRLLAQYPDIAAAARKSSAALQSLHMMAIAASPLPPTALSAQFEERLKAIAPGDGDWRKFEQWGTEILTEIFNPDLGPPDQQVRSDDNLDIMDAVFPIRAGSPPWSLVRAEYVTRFVVAEYKNYGSPIGPRQVESIQQYLWVQAKRQFGLLVSRHAPASQALSQRRRAWLEQDKMIIFLTAGDLVGMLQMRENGEDPFEVIDAQLEDFLRTLSP